MTITEQEVAASGTVGTAGISPDMSKEAFAKQLDQILPHVEKLKHTIRRASSRPTVLGQVNVFRDDIVQPSLPVEKALANAPEREAAISGPKIIEDRER